MNFSSLTEHLEKLRYFISVVDAGSLLRAARGLRLSQPSLSQSMKILESTLGTSLFERTSRGIYLTPSGKRLYDFAKRTLEETEAIEQEIRLQDEVQIERITAGTKEPLALYLWPHYLKRLAKTIPNLDVSLVVKRSNDELMAGLISQKLDLILLPDPPPNENVVAFPVCDETFSFYVSPDLEIDARTPHFLFVHAMCGNGSTIDRTLKSHKIVLNDVRDTDSFGVAKAMAVHGLGIALLPKGIATEEVSLKRLKEIRLAVDPKIFGTVHYQLCLRTNHRKSRRLRAILKEIRAFHTSH